MSDHKNFFAGYPDAKIYDAPGGHKQTARNHLIWGDFVAVRAMTAREKQKFGETIDDKWLPVRARRTSGFMRRRDLQSNRVLEVNFVDVGQGDSCFIVTPDDRRLLIDAGEDDNMYRFLRWRFNMRLPKNRQKSQNPLKFDCAIITHPDADHYLGFGQIFKSHDDDRRDFKFKSVYHNGIVERKSASRNDSLGPRSEKDDQGRRYVLDVVDTLDDARVIIDDPQLRGRKKYPNLLRKALQGGFSPATSAPYR